MVLTQSNTFTHPSTIRHVKECIKTIEHLWESANLREGDDSCHLAPGAVLCLDFRGFTSLSEELDHEYLTRIIYQVMSTLTRTIQRFGGWVERFEGDLLIAFFSPKSSTSSTGQAAIRAGIETQRNLEEMNQLLSKANIRLEARVGIDVGKIQVIRSGEGERSFEGTALFNARCLQEKGAPGRVHVSARLRAETKLDFRWTESAESGFFAEPLMAQAEENQSQSTHLESDCWSLGEILRLNTTKRPVLIEGERRNVVAIFVELEELEWAAQQKSPYFKSELEHQLQTLLCNIIEALGGYVDKVEKCTIMALFGVSQTTLSDVERALLSTLEIVEAISTVERFLEISPGSLRVRAGINYGPVTVAPDPLGHITALGDVVNTASRLYQLAAFGQIFTTASVVDVVQVGFEWRKRGNQKLRGKKESVVCFELLACSKNIERMDSNVSVKEKMPFVGRCDELVALTEKWQQTVVERQIPSIFIEINGGAGIGKRSLVNQFLTRCVPPSGIALRGKPAQFAKRPFNLWSGIFGEFLESWLKGARINSSLLNHLLGQLDSPSLARKLRNSEEVLRALIFGEVHPRVDNMSPEIRRREYTLAIYHACLSVAAINGFFLLVIESLEHVDSASFDTLAYVIRNWPHDQPLLLLATSEEPNRSRGFIKTASLNAIDNFILHLEPLSQGDSFHVLDVLLEKNTTSSIPISDAGRQLIIDRSRGFPLYLEEFSRLLEELFSDSPFRHCEVSDTELGIPQSLRELILARIDGFPNAVRETIKLASVLGDRFSLAEFCLIAAISSKSHYRDLLPHLLELQICERKETPLGSVYQFSHPLVREVSYHSMLQHNRQVLHRLFAEELEREPIISIASHAHNVARHWRAAKDWNRARPWAEKALDECVNNHQSKEGLEWVTYLQNHDGRNSLADNQERDCEILLKEDKLRAIDGQFEKRRVILDRLQSFSIAKTPSLQIELLYRQGIFVQQQGDIQEALQKYEAVTKIEVDANANHFKSLALCNQGYLQAELGNYSQARELIYRALDLCRVFRQLDTEGHCLGVLGNIHFESQYFEEALDCYEASFERFTQIGDRRWQGVAIGYRATTMGVLNRPAPRVREAFHTAINLHRDVNDREYLAYDLARFSAYCLDQDWQVEAEELLGKAGELLANHTFLKVEICLRAVRCRLDLKKDGNCDAGFMANWLKLKDLAGQLDLIPTNERLRNYQRLEEELRMCFHGDSMSSGATREQSHL